MKKVVVITLSLFLFFFYLPGKVQGQTLGDPGELPFRMDIEEVTNDKIPGLHSFAFAHWDRWWIIVGGRIGGLHGFFPVTGFPEDEANINILLLDPLTGEVRSFPVQQLNIPFKDALSGTNPQYSQDGKMLYIAGGYGKDKNQNKFVTFPVLTAIDLPLLIEKIMASSNPSQAVNQIESEFMRVCGGEMEKLGNWFYLVGGHTFSGLYSQSGAPTFTQAYTSEIRKFQIQLPITAQSIINTSVFKDEINLHRRDFSLAPIIRPDGKEGLALYGGVFRPEADLPYYHPVYITEDKTISVDLNYEQQFSQYTCPVVPIYDSKDGSMYSIFFAGLSAHYYDINSKKVVYDDRVPFIRDVTTMRRKADGSSKEFIMPFRFDALLGSNMIFVSNDKAPQFTNEVIKLRDMTGKTFVGWLFGGIKADIPNITTSRASKRMFKVYLSPSISTPIRQEFIPFSKTNIFPNPYFSDSQLSLDQVSDADRILLYDQQGRLLLNMNKTDDAGLNLLKKTMESAVPGMYILRLYRKNENKSIKWMKLE